MIGTSRAPKTASAAGKLPGGIRTDVNETILMTGTPNDPHRITEQHLLQALLRTLRASHHLAAPALTFFGSKLHAAEEQPTTMQALQAHMFVQQQLAWCTQSAPPAQRAPGMR